MCSEILKFKGLLQDVEFSLIVIPAILIPSTILRWCITALQLNYGSVVGNACILVIILHVNMHNEPLLIKLYLI